MSAPNEIGSRLDRRKQSLKLKIDFERYKTILSAPIWEWLWCGTIRTRSYQEGIDGCLLMLHLTEFYKARLSRQSYQTAILKINCLLLDCLDHLDRLEEFDALYRTLKGDGVGRIWIDYRAKIVARKLARSREGKPIRLHHPPEELTDKEINERWNWVCRMARIDIRQKVTR